MQDNDLCGKIAILGGTYKEVCLEPEWNFIAGSGFRAAMAIRKIDNDVALTFKTACSCVEKQNLELWKKQCENVDLQIINISNTITFKYDHPLKEPFIYPRIDHFMFNKPTIEIVHEKVIMFGMIEANVSANSKDMVYDPQSPTNPVRFSNTKSTAKRLVIVVNSREAEIMSGKKNLIEIKRFFFEEEHCYALIIKRGPKGAIVYTDKSDKGVIIPVYKTQMVWPIGSGDIFTTYFAYYWFKNDDIISSAQIASKAASVYCNSMGTKYLNKSFEYEPLLLKKEIPKKVYLAGPFFTFAQRWLINETFMSLKNIGLEVFSPFHDVGLGDASMVVNKDIEGLNESDVIFAIVDGLDSGTLFEIGYAVAQKKKVIAFVQNETKGALKMLEGTFCNIETDFATAIYKTYWYAAE